ncbi:cation transporter [Salinadaptatus halalkaliphilus]|uniref:Cation transporter n=1 Tax=Salinadaptatus halalkaliphilus TaxID=2419781 RepID=A0A4S3TQ21_9EURY|nr:Na+/H+ antiporter subunit E [Salinadaptatus halalkaliphilus]THE65333.1 cation transporter [Salinadaptatus halalkaliphilus]
MRIPAWPVAGAGFAVLWLFVRGVELAPTVVIGQFFFGLAVGLPTAFVFRRLYLESLDLGRGARALPAAGRYLRAFVRELVRANIDVAYRVLSPELPIEPEVILIPLRVETDVAVTLIANSITVTPGTVTLDYVADANALYVHAIDGRDPDAIVAPIRTWENYALEMFDEPQSPSDPVPDIVVSGGHHPRRPDEQAQRSLEERTDGQRASNDSPPTDDQSPDDAPSESGDIDDE